MKTWQLAACTSMTLALALAACGGGGGVNSAASVAGPLDSPTSTSSGPTPSPTPAPSATGVTSTETVIGTPLPPSPALTVGTYDTIAVANTVSWDEQDNSRQTTENQVAPGDLRITVDPATNTYTLAFNPNAYAGLTPPSGALAYAISDEGYGHYIQTNTYIDGVLDHSVSGADDTGTAYRDSSTGDLKNSQFTSLVGLSHVSLGSWNWDSYDPVTDACTTPGCDMGSVVFVYGDRTPPSAIPTSGTATYSTKGSFGFPGNPPASSDNFLDLTADFGAASIAADLGYIGRNFAPYSPLANGYTASLSGSAPIRSTGDFDIALNGTVQNGSWTATGSGIDDVSPFKPEGDPVQVAGTLSGAFFGPDASEIGATLLLPNPDGGMFASAIVAERN